MSDEYNAGSLNVIDIRSMTLPKVIAEIEKRPLMWLPEKNIRFAGVFLDGFCYGRNTEECDKVMTGFNLFVEQKYKIKTNHGWVRSIDHMSSDPHSALDMFFRLFREFMNESR